MSLQLAYGIMPDLESHMHLQSHQTCWSPRAHYLDHRCRDKLSIPPRMRRCQLSPAARPVPRYVTNVTKKLPSGCPMSGEFRQSSSGQVPVQLDFGYRRMRTIP